MNNKLTHYRNWTAQQGVRTFSAPYLPDRMITAVLILIFLNVILALLNQNLQYWFYFAMGEYPIPFIQSLLRVHPLALLGASLAYMLVAWLVLQVLNRSLALIVWAGLAFLHLSQIVMLLGEITGLVSAENTALLAVLQPLLSGLVTGLLLSGLLLRPAKARAPKVVTAEEAAPRTRPWFLNWKVELAAILLVAAVGALMYFTRPQGGWKPVKMDVSPGPRCCAAIAYDTRRERAVMFGGATRWLGASNDNMGDTWEWVSGRWIKSETGVSPMAREYPAMAYDERRGVMVMFGGRNKEFLLNDTWEYDGTAWKNVGNYTTGLDTVPAARVNHQLVFDPTRQKVILLGGYGGKGSNKEDVFTNDAWEWDGQLWHQITSPGDPPVVTSMSLAWDYEQGRLVTMNFDHLLVWDQNRWDNPIWNNPPPARKNAGMASLPGTGVVLFGGYKQEKRTDETWLLRGTTWEQIKSSMHPSPRAQMMMFYDHKMGRVYLYGGWGEGEPFLSDMWEFTLP